jgi:hypothetical protein
MHDSAIIGAKPKAMNTPVLRRRRHRLRAPSVLRPVEQGEPAYRRQADVRLLSFNARRIFMSDCLRLGIY